MDVTSLNGANGFRIDAADYGDNAGFSVDSAGDVNGDGYDDLLIGAPSAEDNISVGVIDEGATYLLFGSSDAFPAVLNLNSINGVNGIVIHGANVLEGSGSSVAAAGDVNGDGFDDITIGAWLADDFPNANHSDEGEAYVIFGRDFHGTSLITVGGPSNDVLQAVNGSNVDILIGGQGDDVLVSDGGADVLRAGAGNDVLAIVDTAFATSGRIVGGSGIDTLRLDGSGLHLDLTLIADNRIVDIERIDIRGNGSNTLTLDARDGLNLSSSSQSVTIHRNIDDILHIGSGWTFQSYETSGNETFEVLTQGNAVLRLQAFADLVSVGFDAVNDHVRDGRVSLTYAIHNAGAGAASSFTNQVYWSPNDIFGDGDDITLPDAVQIVDGIQPGETATHSMNVQLNLAALYAQSVANSAAGGGVGTMSNDVSYLFLAVDVDDNVDETNEDNNAGLGHTIDSDDITYFPWDIDGDGTVTPSDAVTTIRAIGSNDAAHDFDGNGIVTPLEAMATLQRVGYVRNSSVVGDSTSFVSPVAPSSATAVARASMADESLSSTPSVGFGLKDDTEEDLFALTEALPASDRVPRAIDELPLIDAQFAGRTDWFSIV